MKLILSLLAVTFMLQGCVTITTDMERAKKNAYAVRICDRGNIFEVKLYRRDSLSSIESSIKVTCNNGLIKYSNVSDVVGDDVARELEKIRGK